MYCLTISENYSCLISNLLFISSSFLDKELLITKSLMSTICLDKEVSDIYVYHRTIYK